MFSLLVDRLIRHYPIIVSGVGIIGGFLWIRHLKTVGLLGGVIHPTLNLIERTIDKKGNIDDNLVRSIVKREINKSNSIQLTLDDSKYTIKRDEDKIIVEVTIGQHVTISDYDLNNLTTIIQHRSPDPVHV